MLFGGTFATPDQLAIMEEALEAHCLAHNIVDEGAREYIAQFIILMFKGGVQTVEEFRGGLERLRAA
jgi:hypothetical protein